LSTASRRDFDDCLRRFAGKAVIKVQRSNHNL
jgi:hypothetical protein